MNIKVLRLLISAIALCSCGIVFAQEGAPSALNVRGAQYPMVTPDSRVIFRLRAPDAQKVQINLRRLYDMTKDAQGNWTVTTDPQGPGFHYYSLVIYGVSVADPGGHTWPVWRDNLFRFAQILFK